MKIKNIFFINNKIIYFNKPYNIEYVDFIKPGKGQPFIRTKIRNLITQKLIEKTFKYNENIKKANIFKYKYIYIYNDKKTWFFLNKKNFKQILIEYNSIKKNKYWLQEGDEYNIIFWNKKPINIDIPIFIYRKVKSTSLLLSNNIKIALLNKNLKIKVPFFIKKGDFIKIDTRYKSYICRK